MKDHPISPKTCHKINLFMKITALQYEDELDRRDSNCRIIGTDKLAPNHLPTILSVEGLNKTKSRHSCKDVMHIWLNQNIHFFLVIQERSNLHIHKTETRPAMRGYDDIQLFHRPSIKMPINMGNIICRNSLTKFGGTKH